MAEAATSPAAAAALDRSFLWRRLHSLSGVLPVGGYLCYHLLENLSALRGPEAYNEMVNHVNTMLPSTYFHALEIAGVMGPLAFHALYGLYIATTGEANTNRYPYATNWSYWAQRLSAYVAMLYLMLHVFVLRGYVTLGGHHLDSTVVAPGPGKLDLVTYNDVAAHLGNPAMHPVGGFLTGNVFFVCYLVGTIITIYHFTNGLNGFAWTWGIAVGRVAQRRVRMLAWGLFALLSFATLNMLFVLRFS